MNVGNYVRTKDGLIRKIIEIDKYGIVHVDKDFISSEPEYHRSFIKDEIVKSSSQIIDLIEVGDFITYKQGNIYWNVFEQVSGRYNRENQMTDLIVDNKPLNTVEILTVITHEQMEAMQYRVEE